MSLENRKRQYKMFLDRGEKELALDQVKGHPELLEEIKAESSKEKEIPKKKKEK